MPVASSIEADAADGNLDKWKGRIIIVDYTSMKSEMETDGNWKNRKKHGKNMGKSGKTAETRGFSAKK